MMPREKLVKNGVKSLSDSELLAIFLRTGLPGREVLILADQLLAEFQGLRGLMQANETALTNCRGIGPAKSAQLSAVLEMTRRYLQARMEKGESISDPEITRQFLQVQMGGYTREVFACLFLDNQHRLIRYEELFFGTIDGASVHPREVVKKALEFNAAAVIFAHNHPSGISEPSQADKRMTERLCAALGLVEIRVLDHLVVGDSEITSFAERGLL